MACGAMLSFSMPVLLRHWHIGVVVSASAESSSCHVLLRHWHTVVVVVSASAEICSCHVL